MGPPGSNGRSKVEATAELVGALARGWPRRRTVRAAIGHALEFETWRSLVRRQGLSHKQAIDAILRLVETDRLHGAPDSNRT